MKNNISVDIIMTEQNSQPFLKAYEELEESISTALETYSNVHRGSGHYSQITTGLFERSREIVLDHLNLKRNKYTLIFCSPRGEALLRANLDIIKSIKSSDIGLPLGIRAVAGRKKGLSKQIRFLSGGGTAKLISSDWVVWEDGAAGYEAGTPPIINIIAFARALQLTEKYGKDIFNESKHSLIPANILLREDDLEGESGYKLLDKIRQSITGSKTPVPTNEGIRTYVNLDHSSSTPAFRQVWEVAREMLRQPSNQRQDVISETEAICRSFFNAPAQDYDIIFTSNATEAINIAAENIQFPSENEPVLLTTILEHSSNDLPWRAVKRLGRIRLNVNSSGLVDLKEMENILIRHNQDHQEGQKRIELIAITGASNVLGIFNDIAEICRIAQKYGARILVDAAQMAAHRSIDMAKWGIDILAFSSHKTYSPFGSGALIIRKGILNFTGDQEKSVKSSGEENLAGIAALGKALDILKRIGTDLIMEEELTITAMALKELNKIPDITIFGVNDPDSHDFRNKGPVIAFALKNPWPHKLAPALAERGGIGIRSGCHCAHMLVKHLVGVGPKLEKFQRMIISLFPNLNFPGVARISMGLENTPDDISHLRYILQEIASNPAIERKEIRKKLDDFRKGVIAKVFPV